MQKMRGFQIQADARLTKDPELRYTKGAKPVCNVRLCATYAYKGQDQQFKEKPSYLNGVIWGPRAEKQAETLKKGCLVSVEGRLQSRSWKNKDNATRSTVDFIITGITLRSFAKDTPLPEGDVPEVDAEEPVAELPEGEESAT
jgi:single stranded DNA-binding protein